MKDGTEQREVLWKSDTTTGWAERGRSWLAPWIWLWLP